MYVQAFFCFVRVVCYSVISVKYFATQLIQFTLFFSSFIVKYAKIFWEKYIL